MCGLALVRTGAPTEGVGFLDFARRLAPRDPLAVLWHGIGLHAAGRFDEAGAALNAAAILAPADPAPLIHLSRCLLRQHRPLDARDAAGRATILRPSLPEAVHALRAAELAVLQSGPALPTVLAAAWSALGHACLGLDNVLDARAAFRAAVALRPDDAVTAAELALLDHLCGQPLAAFARLRTLLERDPGALPARIHLAGRLLLDGDAAPALALLDQVSPSAADPSRPFWLARRAEALAALGRDSDARTVLAAAERAATPDLELDLCWQRFVLARRASRPEAARLAARAAALSLRRGTGTLERRLDAQFDLGELRHAEGDYRAAFEHWRTGHAMLRRAQPFSRVEHERFLSAVTDGFDARRLANGPRAANTDPAPVFIVGLPRTGTTLLEQILDAHPAVHGAGERLALRQTLIRLAGTDRSAAAVERAALLDAPTLSAAAERFLFELRAPVPHAVRVLDKMPDNVFLLGFVAVLLPGARIICCTRDLRDVGASIFRHRFVGHHPYSHDLSDLGWYMARQQRLLAHWRATLPAPPLLLDHSEWIADFDRTLRRVLAFLDLPFDPACERFYERDRRVGTASRDQVRRPINASGVGRWRLYGEQLAPMLHELSPER